MSAPSPAPVSALAPWPYPRWIAHRGAGKLAPENTLAAFRLGAQHGYRMFECDAKLSADGVPFLMHDATLNRTTNGVQVLGAAASATGGDHPWSVLSQLDAGAWHSRSHAGEPLPTLENLARYCIANGYFLNIEIKPTPGLEEKTGQVVGEWSARLWQGQAVPPLFSSFKPDALAGARATAPQIPRALLIDALWDGCLDAARALGCVAIVCNHALWDRALVAQVQGLGMRTLSYTVNDDWAAQRLIDLGTDGIITDRVDLFSPAL
ncbi:glycerophosphodiester phosphodiesterase [Acidovorax sp. LjRoot129]|uniref:glycerophosphodiester phosphodiesterase n=1 Tax=Acidovorax sp. LjRoot129 TaxID=3342260 RepID=UPI003ED0AFC5